MAHVKLNIVWGLPKAPLDPFSAEKGVEAINLLDNTGFQLESPNGWIPQVAPVKSGGLFADSPLADGATLLNGVRANVTETMTLLVASATLETRQAAMTTLNRYAQLCEDFWESDTQIDPVYLEWQAPGAPGSQYALIYTMEVAEADDPFSEPYAALSSRIIITLTREPFWRALPPGDNPKKWTFYVRGLTNTQWDYNDLDLDTLIVGAEPSLIQETVNNRQTWSGGGLTIFSSSVNETMTADNFVDVPAAQVPGDAPALAHVSVQYANPGVLGASRFLTWVNSAETTDRPRSQLRDLHQYSIVSAARCNYDGADVTNAADTGASYGRRLTLNFAVTPTVAISRATFGAVNNFEPFNEALWRGTYAIFMRYRQVGGTANTITFSLRQTPSTFMPNVQVNTPNLIAQISGIAGNTAGWLLGYLGSMYIPINDIPRASAYGTGLENIPAFEFSLIGARSAGVGIVYLNDFIFVKVSEHAIDLTPTFTSSGSAFVSDAISDSTGYWTRGKKSSGQYIVNLQNTIEVDSRGTFIELQPKRNNRIYALTLENGLSRATDDFTMRVDLIPRWSGVRDT